VAGGALAVPPAAPMKVAAAPFDGARVPRLAVLASAIAGFTGVAAGAFGAHALKTRLDPDALAIFETAARYQLLHAPALLACGWIAQQWPGRAATLALASLAGGIVLFSGSLYALSLAGARALGMITPLGGALLLLGWLCLGVAVVRPRR
jgi:uncharacterized membrane protein YgdD (TMEM256/DUF423 family)